MCRQAFIQASVGVIIEKINFLLGQGAVYFSHCKWCNFVCTVPLENSVKHLNRV